MRRRDFIKGTSAFTAGSVIAGDPFATSPVLAQDKSEVLLAVFENGPNSLDFHTPGANRLVYEVVWNIYDRLIGFGVKKDANGNDYYDFDNLQPELAEEWDLRDTHVILKLRKDATFLDGTPVTAKDVKWAYDRTFAVGGYPKSALAAASLVKAEQFVVVDDHTFRVDFVRHDKLTMPYLGVPLVNIYNSDLVKEHATAADPWGLEWTKFNHAGGGAFRVEKWTPGQEIIYVRNDNWKSGPLPKLKRVICRVVPSGGTRHALLTRGDVDLSFDITPKDASDLAADKNLKVVSSLMENTVQFLGMNVKMKPFDDLKVRQGIAYAIPYQKIIDVAVSGRARPLFGGPPQVTKPEWPQPSPYVTDLAKAKQLLAEAGYPDGFETTLSFDLGAAAVNEPLCVLVAETLAAVGVKAQDRQDRRRELAYRLQQEDAAAAQPDVRRLVHFPDYYFFVVYDGTDPTIYNSMDYHNPEVDKAIETARSTTDPKAYDDSVVKFIQLSFNDLPAIPLFQPYLNAAMRTNVTGYRYLFHRQLDYRHFAKT